MRSDSEIQRDVEEELRADPEINAADVAVAVKDGVVTLAGFVRHYSDKFHAETATKRVAGVKGVANDIDVRLPDLDQTPDPEIAHDAIAAIRHQLPTVREQIKVSVAGGRITLEGEVEWQFQREAAEQAIRRLKGVTGVKNHIHVVPRIAPHEIEHRIEQAFLRSAEVDASHIKVEANGNAVILRGSVRSWAEHEEAERAAWAVPGVAAVDNQVVVRA